jgi:hypothetical protein
MLLTLALLAQTLTPDPEGVKAGRTCAVAVTAARGSEAPGMPEVAALLYYVAQSVKAEGGNPSFLTRVNEVTGELRNEPVQTQATAQANLAECDRRYPLARKAGRVTLPAKPFDRDLMCFAALGVMMGASQGKEEDTGDSSDLKRYKPAFDVYTARLSGDALEKAGLTGETALIDALGKQILASLDLGNFDSISQSCIAQVGN